MNMKTHLFLIGIIAATAVNAVEIGQVVVRQQWPWSTNVKVEYAVTGVTEPVDINVECYDGTTKLESAALSESVSGSRFGISANGIYSLTIDPVKAFGKGDGLIADFRVRLTTSAASSEMSDVLYKIFDLTKQGAVTDVSRADLLNGKYGAIETDYQNIIPGSQTGATLIWTGVTNNPAYKTTHLVMRKISAANKSFTMGAPSGQKGQKYESVNYNGYETQHTVNFDEDFYIAVFPTTKYQHRLIIGSSVDDSDDSLRKPIDNVMWTDLRGYMVSDGILGWWPEAGVWSASGFVANPSGSPHDVDTSKAIYKLRQKTGENGFDLPTEARWEFACKAGTTTATYAGDITSDDHLANDPAVDLIAWCGVNSGKAAHEPGEKAPNPWGLYDMIGNVNELCLDIVSTTMSSTNVTDPSGPTSANRYVRRIVRGTDALNAVTYKCRSAFRGASTDPHVGDNNNLIGYRLMLYR